MNKASESGTRKSNPFRSKPLPFQKGDRVTTPRGRAVITAIGTLGGNLGDVTYRVGRNSYWFGWQLTKASR